MGAGLDCSEAGWIGESTTAELKNSSVERRGRLRRELAEDEPLAREAELGWNMYGPTETTIWSSASAFSNWGDGVSRSNNDQPSPSATLSFTYLDEHSTASPGQWNRRAVHGGSRNSAGVFEPCGVDGGEVCFLIHSVRRDGSRLYRTGDLGRWLADGNIEFLGRNK